MELRFPGYMSRSGLSLATGVCDFLKGETANDRKKSGHRWSETARASLYYGCRTHSRHTQLVQCIHFRPPGQHLMIPTLTRFHDPSLTASLMQCVLVFEVSYLVS